MIIQCLQPILQSFILRRRKYHGSFPSKRTSRLIISLRKTTVDKKKCMMRFGTYRVAVRRSALINKNITFHQRFGGGCDFGSGEDTLFIKSCFDRGLKVYSYSYNLGRCCKDTSSWFVGHNEKYFYDKGVLVRNLFPRSAYLMVLYFAIRFKRETELGVLKRLRLMYRGARNGKKMKPYQGEQ